MKRLAAAVALVLVAGPAMADMYQDGSNANLPEARQNLGAWPTVDAQKDLGCKGDGVTDNAACIAAMMAKTGSPTIYFGPGTYLFNCGTYTFASAATIIGAGRNATILKVKPGCTLPFLTDGIGNGLFNMVERHGRRLARSVDGSGRGARQRRRHYCFRAVIRYSCQSAFLIDSIAITNIPDSSVAVLPQAGWLRLAQLDDPQQPVSPDGAGAAARRQRWHSDGWRHRQFQQYPH